jgi:hypothetical protein
MFSGRTLLFLGLGLFLCLTTLSTTAAGLPRPAVDFPLPVDSYHDQQIPSVFGKLTERIQREPLNLVATIIFFGAIVHTFMAARFRKLAHNYQQSYDAIEHLLHTTDGPPNFGEKHDKLLFRAHPGIWIDGQGHCYCPRCSAKEIKIAKVDSRILSSGGRIKWWDISGTPQIKDNSVLTFVDSNAKTLQRLPRNLLASEQMLRRSADSDGKPSI